MAKSSSIGVALIGFGTVGQGVYDILTHRDAIDRRLSVAIQVKKIVVQHLGKARDVNAPSSLFTTCIDDVLNDPTIDVIVEVMGGVEPAATWMAQALRAGKHVVTANKAALANEGEAILKASVESGKNVLFEAAVAGGIPLIRAIRDGLSANRITGLYGIINGTCNYILSEMASKGTDFEVVLQEAQRLGYAEQDPSFDVEGIDAAHKLLILIQLCFGVRVSLKELTVEGITGIDRFDIQFAKNFGYVIRLLGIAKRNGDRLEARVQPVLIPADRILAKVEGAYNAAYIQADSVGDVMLYGKGAGRYPTASAVVSDILYLAEQMAAGAVTYHHPYGYRTDRIEPISLVPAQERVGTYYVRFTVRDEAHVLETLTKHLAAEGVSIAGLYQPPTSSQTSATIAVLTHDTALKHLSVALKKIDSCGFLVEKSKRIPIELLNFN